MDQDINSELSEIEELLKAVRAALEPLSRDPRLSQWQRVNFDKHGDLLQEYNLKGDYKKARDQTIVEIRKILQELAKLENEYGDLAIDVRRESIKPAAARMAARRIKGEADLLEPLLRELESNCRILFDGRDQILRLITVPGLLPRAKAMSRLDPEELDKGVRFFLFVTREDQEGSQSSSLLKVQTQATVLSRKLKELEFTELPSMAVLLLEHQRWVGVNAVERLKAYIEDFQKYLPPEIKKMQEFREQLKELRRAEPAVIIEQLPKLTARFSNILLDLAYRARNMRQISLMPHFLQKIALLHQALAKSLPEALRQQINAAGSPLNPGRISAENAADFFMGLRGMMLTFKMLFQSLGGSKVITSNELHAKSIEILTACTSASNATEEERSRLSSFLEERLADYGKPFPFDLLYNHMKKLITSYGNRLEQAIFEHPIPDFTTVADPDGKNGKGAEKSERDTTLAKLVNKIEVWGERFEVV